MNINPRRLQHTYAKHAGDFGITGPWNPANGALLEQAIRDHVANPATTKFVGTFRGTIAVTHHLDPLTRLWVAVDAADEFVAGWKLSAAQENHLLTSGNIQ
jgi:hypothetical protein